MNRTLLVKRSTHPKRKLGQREGSPIVFNHLEGIGKSRQREGREWLEFPTVILLPTPDLTELVIL